MTRRHCRRGTGVPWLRIQLESALCTARTWTSAYDDRKAGHAGHGRTSLRIPELSHVRNLPAHILPLGIRFLSALRYTNRHLPLLIVGLQNTSGNTLLTKTCANTMPPRAMTPPSSPQLETLEGCQPIQSPCDNVSAAQERTRPPEASPVS